MHREPLERLRTAVGREVRELGSLGGVAHLVLRRGRCVFTCADGVADPFSGSKRRFGLDTICALHGCSKPLVTAAFLTLVDEGRVRLSDPLAKYMPFAKPRAGPEATVGNLLTMTAGIGYTDTPAYGGFLRRVRRGRIADLGTFCKALSALPLVARPGARYEYSYCTDVLGRLCEILAGEPLHAFVARRLLRPLGMRDTHFPQALPSRKRPRLAVLSKRTWPSAAKRRRGVGGEARPFVCQDSAPGIASSGGGILSYNDAGMLSTVRDQARFCQMLLDDGVGPGGRRVLKVSTVRGLWRDGLVPYARANGRVLGWNDCGGRQGYKYWDRVGWSALGAHVTFSARASPGARPRSGLAMFMGGGGGAYWVVDRKRKLVVVSFEQCFGGSREVYDGSDGYGPRANDAATFARAAADRSPTVFAHDYGNFGAPGWPAAACAVKL